VQRVRSRPGGSTFPGGRRSQRGGLPLRERRCGSGTALVAEVGFDDGFVRVVGDAVVVEVVPAGGAAALVGVGPVGPFVQVGLVHASVAVAIAGARGVAGQQGSELVAQALVVGLLLGA